MGAQWSDIADAIEKIYESIVYGKNLENTLDKILDTTGSRSVMISIFSNDRGNFVEPIFHGPQDSRFVDGIAEYKAEKYRDDPSVQFGVANPPAGAMDLGTLLRAQGWSGPQEAPFGRWLQSELGMGDFAVRFEPLFHRHLTLALALHKAETGFTPAERQVHAMLFRHLQQAVRIALRPPHPADPDDPHIFLDTSGRAIAVGPGAARMLAAGDGIALADHRLHSVDARADRALGRAIRSACTGLVEGTAAIDRAVLAPRPSGRRAFALIVAPLPPRDLPFGAGGARAMVRIVDPEPGTQPRAADRLAALYGLTPAERRLAETLLAGDGSLRAIAGRLGIAYPTARAQLANLFGKTGTSSQSQLVRLLVRLA